jgi:hypothetical protein
MENEVITIEVEPKMFDVKNEPGKTSFRLDYFKDVYAVNQPITCRPEYLAISDPAGIDIELLFRKLTNLIRNLKGEKSLLNTRSRCYKLKICSVQFLFNFGF